MTDLPYLAGYHPTLQGQVRDLLERGKLGDYVQGRYGEAHQVRNDRALFEYAQELKARHLKTAPPLDRVLYDNKLHIVRDALGLHTTKSRVHGAKLKTSREIRVATLFRDAPAPFLDMILVHELAHFKEREHDKAFYRLCQNMLPDYHQLEFDARVWLTWVECR